MDKVPSIEELKDIIKGLRMSTFSFVDPNAIDEINHMIQTLPVPEELDRLTLPMAIKKIRKDVGNIMRIIELYGKRDKEYKIRYKSRTGLPPRYKVLEWRSAMKKSEFLKEMVKVSSVADDKGNADIAGKLILFAKKVQEGNVEEQEVDDTIIMLKAAGFDKEAQMIREAGWMSNMWQGVKNVGKSIAQDVGQTAQNVGQAAKEYGQKQVGRYQEGVEQGLITEVTKDLGNIAQTIQATQKKLDQISKVDPKLAEQMNQIANQLKYMYGIATNAYEVIDETESQVSNAPAATQEAPINFAEQNVEQGTATPQQSAATVKLNKDAPVKYNGADYLFKQYMMGGKARILNLQDKKIYTVPAKDVQPSQPVTASVRFNLRKLICS